MTHEIDEETLFFALSYAVNRVHFSLRGRSSAHAADRIAFAILDYWRLNDWHVFHKSNGVVRNDRRPPPAEKWAMKSHLALVEEINRGVERDAV